MTFVQKGVTQDHLTLTASEAPLGLAFNSFLESSLSSTVKLASPIIPFDLVTVSASEKMTWVYGK